MGNQQKKKTKTLYSKRRKARKIIDEMMSLKRQITSSLYYIVYYTFVRVYNSVLKIYQDKVVLSFIIKNNE